MTSARVNDIREPAMTDANPVLARIETDVRSHPVVLYMKGSPVFPQCGFSAQVVQVLSELGVRFQSYDVLSDDSLRQGIKEYSNWPTIPQLYVQGEFVGGCDIISEMYLSGELAEFLREKGIEAETAAALPGPPRSAGGRAAARPAAAPRPA